MSLLQTARLHTRQPLPSTATIQKTGRQSPSPLYVPPEKLNVSAPAQHSFLRHRRCHYLQMSTLLFCKLGLWALSTPFSMNRLLRRPRNHWVPPQSSPPHLPPLPPLLVQRHPRPVGGGALHPKARVCRCQQRLRALGRQLVAVAQRKW